MSSLNNPDGSHSQHTLASKLMDIIHAPIVNALARHNVIGTEVSDSELKFKHEGKSITIRVIVK